MGFKLVSIRRSLALFTMLAIQACALELATDPSSVLEDGDDLAIAEQAITAQPDTTCTYAKNGTQEYWFCTGARTWTAARTLCQGVSMDLARIDNQTENDYVRGKITANAWIGGSDVTTEGTWRWSTNNDAYWIGTSTGAAQGGRYTKWLSAEPNNSGESDCAEMRQTDGAWTDVTCASTRQVVCESTAATASAPKAPDTACTRHTNAGKTYWVCNNDRTWDAARASCKAQGMDLAAMDDGQVENDFVKSKITRDAHIGLDDRAEDGVWRFSANRALSMCGANGGTPALQTFSAWDVGQPRRDDNLCKQIVSTNGTYYLCDKRLDYAAARSQCGGSAGMSLVKIDSQLENDWLKSHLVTESWIGMDDLASEGTFKWQDGSTLYAAGAPVPGVYSSWAWFEPNNLFDTEDCGEILMDGAWNDDPCTDQHPWICEGASDTGVPDLNDCGFMKTGTGKWQAGSCAQLRPFVCESLPAKAPVIPDAQQCGTPVSWTGLDGAELPTLADPFTPQETWTMSNNFSWGSTSTLPETNPDGSPTLYYAAIYIEDPFQVEAMKAYNIDYNFLPFFPQERARWGGQKGVFEFEGDGRGVFAFAIIGGKMYNAIRAWSLANTDIMFRAIVLRTPPAGATSANGSLSYPYLRAGGYQYAGIGPNGVTGGPVQKGILKDIGQGIVELGEEIVDETREFIGDVGEIFKGEATVKMHFAVMNTDWAFNQSNHCRDEQLFCNTNMTRAWGDDRGSAIPLKGVEVRVSQGLIGFSLNTGKTDDKGYAQFKVMAGSQAEVCVHIENSAAQVTAHLTEKNACDFGFPEIPASALSGHDNHFYVRAKNRNINALAAITDARDYAEKATGKKMHKAEVLIGKLADAFPHAIAPCLDFPNWEFKSLMAALTAAAVTAGGQHLPGLTALNFLQPDMVLPKNDAASRGIPVHEYGHYFMCNLIYDNGGLDAKLEFANAWTNVMVQRVFNNRNAEHSEPTYIAEAWADAFAAQVVGGVNYFDLGSNWGHYSGREGINDAYFYDASSIATISTSRGVRASGMYYCNPGHDICLDDNLGSDPNANVATFPFRQESYEPLVGDALAQQVGRVTTLMHDMFDGRRYTDPIGLGGNGAFWLPRPVLSPYSGEVGPLLFDVYGTMRSIDVDARDYALQAHQSDESVVLTGRAWLDIIQEWSRLANRLGERSFFKAFSFAMKQQGVSDLEICKLFALHSSTGLCPNYLPVSQNIKPPKPVLSVKLTPNQFSRDAIWTWSSDAPFATEFRWVIRNETANTTIGTGSRAYSVYDEPLATNALPWNAEVSGRVTVYNGSTAGAPAEARITTPAQPVATVTVSRAAARTTVCWTGTAASAYGVELRAGTSGDFTTITTLDDATTASQCYVVYGLPATTHQVRVTSVNRFGDRSTPSPIVSFTPIAATGVYVSNALGNDADPAAGSSTKPFKTLAAAMSFVRHKRSADDVSYTAVQFNMGAGTYTTASMWSEFGGRTTIVRGALNDTTWQPASVTTTINPAVSVPDANSCLGAPHRSSFIAKNNGAVILQRVTVTAAPIADGVNVVCQSVLAVDKGFARVETSVLRISGPAAVNACQFGVSATGGAADQGVPKAGNLEVVATSTITAGLAETSPTGNFLGLCTNNLETVRIEDSTVNGVNGTLSGSGSSFVAGGYVLNGGDLTVTRSELSASSRKFGYTTNQGSDGGLQYGLITTNMNRTMLNSSVIRSGRGYGIAMQLGGAPGGTIKVFHTNAIAGDDWALDFLPTLPASGMAVVLTGAPSNLVIANSVFAYASGRLANVTSLDMAQLTSPKTLYVHGNAFSAVRRSGVVSSPTRCAAGTVRPSPNDWSATDAERFVCNALPERVYDVGDNVNLTDTPCFKHASPLDCEDGEAYLGVYSDEAAQFDTGGKSTLIGGSLRCNGVNLTRRPEWPELRLTKDKVARTNSSTAKNMSIGAFHEQCTADDFRFKVY